MNIRSCIFSILLAILVFPGSVFAENRNMTADEYMKMLGAESASRVLPLTPKDDKWGEPSNGFAMQLVPRSEEFIVGKPMILGLVMKNTSDSVKQYTPQPAFINPVIILDANNKELYYKKGPFQSLEMEAKSIGIGDIVTLFDNLNITEDYVITEPGKYTIRFRGPSYNVIGFEIKPGTPDERDVLIASLYDILPDPNWQIIKGLRENIPAGRKNAEGNAVVLYRIRSRIRVMLWQTKSEAEIDEHGEDPQTSDYLGKNASGYFYITAPPKALEYWPTMKADIVKALKLESKSE